MGFIKNAIVGILIYEGIKYWLRKNAEHSNELGHIALGGKLFVQNEVDPLADTRHRHNLDRPEIISELHRQHLQHQ